MTKTDIDELEQKYLPWKDTPTAQQILRLINEYRQLTAKNNLGSPQPYQVCLEANTREEFQQKIGKQLETSCQNYPPVISDQELAQKQEFARQQHLLDIQERESRRQSRVSRKIERKQGSPLIKTGSQNLELFEDEQ